MSHEDPIEDLSLDTVVTKYRAAADVANAALAGVVALCVEGADIATLCDKGDEMINEMLTKTFKKKEKGETVRKGVAFPTSIAPNELLGNFSPYPADSRKLANGELVKVDLGVHIDGYVAVAAHSFVVGQSQVEGRAAEVLMAAHTAGEVALRLVKVGGRNGEVTKAIAETCKAFGCAPVQGVLSHEMKRHILDGNNCIINCETNEDKVDEFEFEVNQVYGIDIVVSTGEGKPKEIETKSTVYKRDVETVYNLKTPLPRQFLSEVNRRFPTMPFTLKALEVDDDKKKMVRLGVSECVRHQLIHRLPVMAEKAGELVAQFRFTVLILPSGQRKITGLPLTQTLKTDKKLEVPELVELLKVEVGTKKAKKESKPTEEVKTAE